MHNKIRIKRRKWNRPGKEKCQGLKNWEPQKKCQVNRGDEIGEIQPAVSNPQNTVEKCMSFMRINAQSGGEKIKIKSNNKEIRTNFDINGLLGQI